MNIGLRCCTVPRLVAALIAALIATLAMPPIFAQHTRPRRLGSRPNPFPAIPARSRTLPAGMILILRIESRLDSSASRAGDRFTARVQGPVRDAAGNVVLPAESEIIGHLAAVTPAQLGRRSGVIEVAFDRVRIGGREFPVKGELTSADEDERERIDAEGRVTGGSTAGRSIAFVGGGTAYGAVIGVITGSALVGAGIGAAAGATAALLAKGKEAVVEPGTLVGLRLTEPLDLSQAASAQPAGAATAGNTTQSGSQLPTSPQSPAPVREWQPVSLSFAQAERTSEGEVLMMITAETKSVGWSLRANYKVSADTLEVWVMGLPPEGAAAQRISHPTLTLSVPDKENAIRYVIIHAVNGDRRPTLRIPPTLSRQLGR